MEKYNKFRNGSVLIRANRFNTSATETQWKRKMPSTNGAGTTEYSHVRRRPLPHPTLCTNQLKPGKTPKESTNNKPSKENRSSPKYWGKRRVLREVKKA